MDPQLSIILKKLDDIEKKIDGLVWKSEVHGYIVVLKSGTIRQCITSINSQGPCLFSKRDFLDGLLEHCGLTIESTVQTQHGNRYVAFSIELNPLLLSQIMNKLIVYPECVIIEYNQFTNVFVLKCNGQVSEVKRIAVQSFASYHPLKIYSELC